MNIIFDIGIYMLASSLVMVGYVWFRSFKHSRLEYKQLSETLEATEKSEPVGKNIAA